MRTSILLVAIPFLLAGATGSVSGQVASTVPALRDAPAFTPMTIRPRLINEKEVQTVLAQEYPAALRDAGIGGTVEVWLFIDATGKVDNTIINKGSGNAELDEAARKVAAAMKFTPAQNREQIVPVWVSIPVTFRTG